jgi:hypothetical protein
MRVQEDTRQCVVFLCREDKTFVGTGFLVVVPFKIQSEASSLNPKKQVDGFLNIVTAKHVAQQVDGSIFFVRVNNKQGSFEYLKMEDTKWFYHPTNNSIDVAVAPFSLSVDIDYRTITADWFLTDKTLSQGNIGIGDEVYIVGLFAHVAGSKRNEPIVRIGNIAMLPAEPIPTENGNIEGYLIEARSIGGISGSPVFVRESFPRSGKHYLLGLMQAHWEISAALKNDFILTKDFNAQVNMGIAIVIPAKKILETLNHPLLVDLRSKIENKDFSNPLMP